MRQLIFQSQFFIIIFIFCISPKAWAEKVVVCAPPSLQESLPEIEVRFRQRFIEGFKFVTMPSDQLARKINEGAKCDIFISDSDYWMRKLMEKGKMNNSSVEPILVNTMVLVLHESDSDQSSFSTMNWDDSRQLAVARRYVPSGDYARSILKKHRLLNLWEPFFKNVDDEKEALKLVEKRKVKGAFVYRTDAYNSDHIKIVKQFAHENFQAVYYAGIVRDKDPKRVWPFLFSDSAAEVFVRNGFAVTEN